MKIAEAIDKIKEVEQANTEHMLQEHDRRVVPLTRVELSIGLDDGEKLVRYAFLSEFSIAEGTGDLRFAAYKKGITGEIHLFAEWREEGGDKVGKEFDCVVDEAEAEGICRETYAAMANYAHQQEFLAGA